MFQSFFSNYIDINFFRNATLDQCLLLFYLSLFSLTNLFLIQKLFHANHTQHPLKKYFGETCLLEYTQIILSIVSAALSFYLDTNAVWWAIRTITHLEIVGLNILSSLKYGSTLFSWISVANAFGLLLLRLISIYDFLTYSSWSFSVKGGSFLLLLPLAYNITLFLLVIIPLFFPRAWSPTVKFSKVARPSPEQTCSIFSLIFTYGWLNGIIWKSWKKPITLTDVPALPDTECTQIWYSRFAKNDRKSLMHTILLSLKSTILLMVFLSVLVSSTLFVTPLAIKKLLQYLQNPKSDEGNSPFLWVFVLLIGPYLASVVKELYVHVSRRFMLRIKAAITQMIYKKVLTSKTLFVAVDGSKINLDYVYNLLAKDVDNIGEMREFIGIIARAPLEMGVSMYFLYQLLGWSAYVGLLLAILSSSFPLLVASKISRLTSIANTSSDERIRLTTELLKSIKITKLFGWERPMLSRIQEKRSFEVNNMYSLTLFDIIFKSGMKIAPFISMFITFAIYTKIMGHQLTPATAFTSISMFGLLRYQFIWLASVSRQFIQFKVSLKRVDNFVYGNMVNDSSIESSDSFVFENTSLSWSPTPSTALFQLKNLNFTIPRNQFTLVVGSTGSGKSTLAMALLGELHVISGKMTTPSISQRIAYVPQAAWLRNGTIRSNILFGEPYDEERYFQIIKACCLDSDLNSMNDGDLTYIHSNGSSLSGGQKQRVSLARALYSNAEVYIFDDIFSALDVSTSRKIYESCFLSTLLQHKTIILFTHNVSLCLPIAENVIVLKNSTAQLVSPDSIQELVPSTFFSSNTKKDNIEEENLEPHSFSFDSTLASSSDNDEQRDFASNSSIVLLGLHYLKYFGSNKYILGSILLVMMSQVSLASIHFWIALWSGNSLFSLKLPSSFSFLWGYAILLFIYFLMDLSRAITFAKGGRTASENIHDILSERVLYSPLHWFEKTAAGRILNRFSKDMYATDNLLWASLEGMLLCVMAILITMLNVTLVMPIFMVPAAFVSLLVYLHGYAYSKAQKQLTSLQSSRTSPVFTMLGETLGGITVIRAFKKEKIFEHENMAFIDDMIQPLYISFAINRWLAIRTDGISGLVGFSTGLIALLRQNIPPGLVGFSLNSAIGFNISVLVFVRANNEILTYINNFRRLYEYMLLPSEKNESSCLTKPMNKEWPTLGHVSIKNLTVSYSIGQAAVLEDINLEILPKEKIAIVGRTGSGKSTMGLTLLRFTMIMSGAVEVDGIDINSLDLEVLRQRISLIPQDPVLISGTVRSNLDPFEEYGDGELNEILKTASCESLVQASNKNSLDAFAIHLDTPVDSGGVNFSSGQRQILALARALVRKSRIVILDESTASVDDTTDRRIQQMLRAAFKHATVLCIAHRIKTIVDYDKVLVLDSGKTVEFGSPKSLYTQRRAFWKMCKESHISL
ncbi:ATP-binding cassette transporter abc1 [Schizosaccharomyces pombe]